MVSSILQCNDSRPCQISTHRVFDHTFILLPIYSCMHQSVLFFRHTDTPSAWVSLLQVLHDICCYAAGAVPAGDGTANTADGLGSQLIVRLHGFTVHNKTAGSFGALSTTVQLKGFNLDVIPAPIQGLQGTRCLHMWCTPRQTLNTSGMLA